LCFVPGGDLPPRRAIGAQAEPSPDTRYFGPGTRFDALERIYKQLATAKIEDTKGFGKDILPQAQLSAVQHLLMFWRAKSPYSPPVHSRAEGSLQVIHRYAQIWQQLSRLQPGAGGLSIADDEDGVPQVPETWALRDTGGNELGADLPHPSGGWAKCGELVGVSACGGSEYWVGIVRRMHAASGGSLHADIAVLSREPQPVSLRARLEAGEEAVHSEESSRHFAFNTVHAIILSDGSEGSQAPNLLLPSVSWKEGRIYEALVGEPARYLRGLQVVRRGDDYVRATFEWVSGPGA
jgi:hypothetical protein